jgi:hypothetical protein
MRRTISVQNCFGIAALALPLFAAAPAHAVDFAPAAPGHRFEYECRSNIPNPINPARTTEIRIEQVEGGVVTFAKLVNGTPRYEVRQPLSLYGTGIFEQVSTMQGGGHADSGIDKFPKLHDLEIGATYEGKIKWAYESGRRITYDVTLTISEESEYRSGAYGYVPVIVIEETWTGYRTNNTYRTFISPEHSAVIAWQHEVGRYGREECWLTAVQAP